MGPATSQVNNTPISSFVRVKSDHHLLLFRDSHHWNGESAVIHDDGESVVIHDDGHEESLENWKN